MKTVSAALLYFCASTASAQAWQADLESGQGAAGLVLVVCTGLAFFFVKNEFRSGTEAGVQAIVICAGVGLAALFFPPVRIVLALVTVAFFVYGFLNRS